MTAVLLGILLRAHPRRPWLGALAGLGIALGVAVVVAIQLAQSSAHQAFDAATDAIFGNASHRVEAGSRPITDVLCATLRHRFPELVVTPVLRGHVRTVGAPGRWLEVVGIDPLAAPVQARLPADAAAHTLAGLMGGTQILANTATRRALRVSEGSYFSVITPRGASHDLPLPTRNAGSRSTLPDDVLLMDIAVAQDLLGARGQLTHIDLVIADDKQAAALIGKLRRFLGKSRSLRDLRAEAQGRRELSRAFETSLSALSLMSLLVGMFLVYNTTDFLAVQRQPVCQRLRALGVSRGVLFTALMGEILLLGAAASVLGVAGGIALARGMLGLVDQTMQGFYLASGSAGVHYAWRVLGAGWLAGTLATGFAGLPAAWRAARIEPRARAAFVIATAPHGRGPELFVALAAFTSAALLQVSGGAHLWLDFLSLSLGLVGFACLIPAAVRPLVAALGKVFTRAGLWPEALAAASLRRSDQRASTAIAALCLAIGVSLGMQTMTLSFRAAVDGWLGRLLRADAYLSLPDEVPAETRDRILTRIERALRGQAELAATSHVARWDVPTPQGPVLITAYSLPPEARAGFEFLAGDDERLWAEWETHDVVMVSEPFARRQGLQPGQTWMLDTPTGSQPFRVGAIFRDYASERGTVAMSARTARRHWSRAPLAGVGLYLAQNPSLGRLKTHLSTLDTEGIPLLFRSRAELRRHSLAIFDDTFAITRVLALLAIVVSLTGVAGSLFAQVLERLREHATLRALGADRRILLRVLLAQVLLMGISATALALPLGLAVAVFLIRVVNVHAFGWTMPVYFSAPVYLALAACSLLACALAVAPAAIRLFRVPPAWALREE